MRECAPRRIKLHGKGERNPFLSLSLSLFLLVADKFSTASRFVLSQRFIYTKDSSLTLPLSAPSVPPRSASTPFFLIYRPVALHGLASLLASYTPPIHTRTARAPRSTFIRESCLADASTAFSLLERENGRRFSSSFLSLSLSLTLTRNFSLSDKRSAK